MPTYTLISSNVLTSSATSVTFSAIPSTYTDLVVRASVRQLNAGKTNSINITINGLNTSIYSLTRLYSGGSGFGAFSARSSGSTSAAMVYTNGDTSTSNTFTSLEYYIPSYTASQSKPFSNFSPQEDNDGQAFMNIGAHLFRDNGAITSLALASNDQNFAIGSSFYLYGISNA